MDATAYIRRTMRPMRPLPTGFVPHLPRLEGIEAVVFDIYGTLLISAQGDLGSAGEGTRTDGADGRGAEIASLSEEFGVSEAYFDELFYNTVKRHQTEGRLRGIEYPEVEIREVWSEILVLLGLSPADETAIEEIALRYECEKNPVWLMPGAVGLFEVLWGRGHRLGIVSNAQFYTERVIEGLFGANPDGLGFDPGLQVYSYREREGKPSRRLYTILADRASRLGISPESIFYLGNDMTKDVLPARETGFRTGLFAGDNRSLRLGGLTVEEASSAADAVITDLAQVPDLFHIPA